MSSFVSMFPALVSSRFLAVSMRYEGKRCFVSFSFPSRFPRMPFVSRFPGIGGKRETKLNFKV